VNEGERALDWSLKAKRGNEMRIFAAFLIVFAAAYWWDAQYNYGKYADGLRGMGRSMSHFMGR
jgi:hypothetical protein